jgi:hydroxymethylpyrimidine pyrophosphatase-like HAD family hydrolase
MPHYFRAIALDYDGTIAEDGRIHAGVLEAVAELRRRGRHVVLCTGRILHELRDVFPECDDHFDAIVAENGAVLRLRGHDARATAPPLPAELFEALRRRRIPARVGEVLIATQARFDGDVLHEIARLELDAQLVRNRSELMVLPAGVSKGTGLAEALAELHVSRHSALAIGDAENDHAMLVECEIGVAVRNAVQGLRERADIVLAEEDGAGVAAFLRDSVLTGDVEARPARWRVDLGIGADGRAVTLPGSRINVLVAGASGAGKSYTAGAFVERLFLLGYTVCIFDSEGDHGDLEQLRGVVTVGGTDTLPGPSALARLIRNRFTSVVIDLSLLPPSGKLAYFDTAVLELCALRREGGLPHWIVIEEADQLLDGRELPAEEPGVPPLGYCLVTHRPGALPRAVLDSMHGVIALGGAERYAAPSVGVAPVAPFALPLGEALLGLDGAVTRFHVGARIAAPHVRHRRKYLYAQLPPERRFYFADGDSVATGGAANLAEFCRDVANVTDDVLRQHLVAGDFSRWVRDVMADDDLARRLRSLERWFRNEPDVTCLQAREGVLSAVEMRYPPASPERPGD